MLSDDQLVQFGLDGYVVVAGAVSEEFLADSDTEIDGVIDAEPPPGGTVGRHFYFLPPGRLPAADAALHRSGALGLAEDLVAPLGLTHALDHIQIALNIPPFRHRPGGPHLDGHRPEQSEPSSFTMLAAVFLSDESRPDCGNLWVWPGSHLAHTDLFRQQGAGVLLGASGHSLSLDQPPVLSEPRPLLANRGDLLLAHFLLGHNIGGNLSERPRRILYFRLSCPGHRERWDRTFLDPFAEYEPVRRALDWAGLSP